MIFALVTDQGTAASETALCPLHVNDPVASDRARRAGWQSGDVPNSWVAPFHDCTGNDELYCLVCGLNWRGESEP